MFKNHISIIFVLLIIITVSCAKRGVITGGDKDTIAPVLKASFPKNFSTNFNGKEIRLVFDEYIKLKNITKQLIVSPPMKNQPEILPYTASKEITIKLKDTLLANTTYSFNFGQSIEDNNEGNPLSQFKYIFSTGSYIDSLSLKVNVKNALEKKTDSYISVMLYEINPKFNDSTIYKEAPKYISNTLDNLTSVKLENIKAGKYLLVALKDNGNNKFDPKSDKIGFQKQYITIPNDTVFELELFKEKQAFKALHVSQATKNKLVLGHEGKQSKINITVKNGKEIIPSKTTLFPKKDSLQIWYKPIKADSLQIEVREDSYYKNFNVKINPESSKLKLDTLSLSTDFVGNLPLRERFSIRSNTPLLRFDESKITLFDKDSVAVPFKPFYNEMEQKFFLDFDKQPLQNYTITLFPGALVDFYEKPNDKLTYKITTRNTTDYGNLKVILDNVKKFPVLIELTDKEGNIKATESRSAGTEKETTIDFLALEPALYTLRVIYDDNKNKQWDAGSFLEKRQSEEVIYFPKEIDVRANWDVEQSFDLSK